MSDIFQQHLTRKLTKLFETKRLVQKKRATRICIENHEEFVLQIAELFKIIIAISLSRPRPMIVKNRRGNII